MEPVNSLRPLMDGWRGIAGPFPYDGVARNEISWGSGTSLSLNPIDGGLIGIGRLHLDFRIRRLFY